VHYGVEEITVNVRKMLKKFYWTYLLIWRSLKVALNMSIILKYIRGRVVNLWLESILKCTPEICQHFCRYCEELISEDWAKLM
jgi:hypothetical protein